MNKHAESSATITSPDPGLVQVKWFQVTPAQALHRLGSDREAGLTSQEAQARLAAHGANVLVESGQRTRFKILMNQLKSSLVALLLAAMLVSIVVGEYSDAIAILAIIVINTLLGYWQDYRAEKSMAELKKMSVPEVVAVRDSKSQVIPSSELVVGDIVNLQSGYIVPADCRMLEAIGLSVDESALTGESFPVDKQTDAIDVDQLVTADQGNIGFMGTVVVNGRGVAVVTQTGMETELGQIARSLQSVSPKPTPLQRRLAQLSKSLAILVIVVVAVVYGVGILVGQESKLMLMTALSLAVAAVPEGLPAVATVAMAIGARRMFRREALIRQLPAVESLGSVSIICSDKTGTLTQNKMSVSVVETANGRVDLGTENPEALNDSTRMLLAAACLCNDAKIQRIETKIDSDVPLNVVGEPTEAALVNAAANAGIGQDELIPLFPRVGEFAFSSERKRMVTVHRWDERAKAQFDSWFDVWDQPQICFAKGAVDSVLSISTQWWDGATGVPLEEAQIRRLTRSADELAGQGTRVLAIGFRRIDSTVVEEADVETGFVLLGLVGLSDPPRPEAKSAVQRCRLAGIRPIMITGDHPLTALSIANQLSISTQGGALTGAELADLSAADLGQRVREVSVFARVAPEDKLNIVQALQDNQEIVAMTGDGVNDAPALKRANVGVAMGKNGTDVAKQAADVVLLDDNFSTIVDAVEQGRIVYANVRKFVKYTMSSNVGEVFVMAIGVMLGMPLPLLPLQILWINLVTDGLPGLALAIEPVEEDTMNRPPAGFSEAILSRRLIIDIAWIGVLIGTISLWSGTWLSSSESTGHWRTVIFSVLTFSQMGNVLASRTSQSVFTGRAQTNNWLLGAVVLTCMLQMLVIYAPPFQAIFDTQALAISELAICGLMGGVVFLLIEFRKLLGLPKSQSAKDLESR